MTKQEYKEKINEAIKCKNPSIMHTLIIAADTEYIGSLEQEIERLNSVNVNNVSSMELDVCRKLNQELREDNTKMRKELEITISEFTDDITHLREELDMKNSSLIKVFLEFPSYCKENALRMREITPALIDEYLKDSMEIYNERDYNDSTR